MHHSPPQPRPHSRFVGPEEEDLVFIGGGFDCSFWHLVNLCDTKWGEDGGGQSAAPPTTTRVSRAPYRTNPRRGIHPP